jgi:hypothetical protein
MEVPWRNGAGITETEVFRTDLVLFSLVGVVSL